MGGYVPAVATRSSIGGSSTPLTIRDKRQRIVMTDGYE